MVRIRYPDSVKIQIGGVKSIIPKSRIEIGRRSMTWLTFLNEVCKIELNSSKQYFICTSGYSPNHTVEGWTASLTDKIDQFVVRFTKKLRKYCVRLHNGQRPTQKTNNPQTLSQKVQTQPKIQSSVKCASPLEISPLRKPIRTLVARKFASIVPMKPSQLALLSSPKPEAGSSILGSKNCEEIMEVESNESKNMDDSDPLEICEVSLLEEDNLENDINVCNTAQVVKSRPTEKKLEGDNLVSKFEQEVDKMDDSMLDQICEEIKKLRQSGQWGRNLKRSPLACSLLWEICKE